MSTNPKVSIIFVNYFSEDDIKASIASIVEQSIHSNFEILIVSNSTITQKNLSSLESKHHQIRIFEQNENTGFAKACNFGASKARGSFLFFLNPDTSFKNNVIDHLLEFQLAHPDAWIIGPKTLNPDKGTQSATIKHDFNSVSLLALAFPLLKPLIPAEKKKDHFKVKQSMSVPIVNGHALFVEKEIYKSLGGMDENFFMYYEENDLCLRTRKSGGKVYFCAKAELYHAKGSTTSRYFVPMEIVKHQSKKKFLKKHYPSGIKWNRSAHIIGYIQRLLVALLIFKKNKIQQYYALLKWYLFSYQ
ncbi:glycosyltransferase family 2 protein [Gracilimonas mengyeensis]|uniref:Glycosyltransferase 2-like domain-containing protein n=1 Tax=Gracilimonas mengyeensis TaxID=1302730 RepID=A0A521DFV3_9BACT|nr:glycosyltransferase family 2 protein [Gracilimonas mengyeensis]SMO70496.1 hypothetical protein SAMN06265219_108151 [Gracilimonas mengyeensis]